MFHDIGGRIPGFAGFYFDADGTVNVMLVDLKQNGLARREVSELLERTRGRALGHMKVKQVKYNFRQLYRWKELITGAPQESGFTTIGICEKENRVCMSVHRGGGLALARDLVSRLGIPSDAISIEEGDPVTPAKLLTEVFSPVPGGVRVSPRGCTLGFNALYGTQRVFVTAAHCTDVFGSTAPASLFGQPNAFRRIGVESYDPPTFPCTVNGVTYSCRRSDAAEVQYHDTVAVRLGRIARPYFNSTTVDPNNPEFRIIGERQFPYVGETVSFVGQISGWREGPVSGICLDLKTEIIENDRNVLLKCQTQIDVAAQDGDSGAPTFHRSSYPGDVYLAGILNSRREGRSYYSPMQNIEKGDTIGDGFGDYQTTAP